MEHTHKRGSFEKTLDFPQKKLQNVPKRHPYVECAQETHAHDAPHEASAQERLVCQNLRICEYDLRMYQRGARIPHETHAQEELFL